MHTYQSTAYNLCRQCDAIIPVPSVFLAVLLHLSVLEIKNKYIDHTKRIVSESL